VYTTIRRSATTRTLAALLTLTFTLTFTLTLTLAITALAGCGTTSTANASSKSPTATATSVTAPSQTCQTDQLALALERNGVALGHVADILRIDNRGPYTCSLEGYPTIELLDANRVPLPTHQQRTTMAYTFNVSAPQSVVLAAGAAAYFHLEWSDDASSGQFCASNAAYLQVTPPQNQTPLLLQLAVGACDGNIITSPLVPTPAY
jgi:hypothetical protein